MGMKKLTTEQLAVIMKMANKEFCDCYGRSCNVLDVSDNMKLIDIMNDLCDDGLSKKTYEFGIEWEEVSYER